MSSLPGTSEVRSAAWPVPQWLRDPLIHFVVIGGLLFAIDHFVVRHAGDPRTIVVGADVDAEARTLFRASRGRDPSAQELSTLRRRWLDNEVLYREGLALHLDQGDPTIRERIIFKALSVVESNLQLPPVDERTLRAWFDANHARYDESTRTDFLEAVLPGETGDAPLRSFAAQLNSGLPGDAKGGLRVFKGRPRESIEQSFGADFAQVLEKLPPGEWKVLPSSEGLRVVRLESLRPGVPAVFEAHRAEVLQDWKDATMQQLRTAAVRKLGEKYAVRTAQDGK